MRQRTSLPDVRQGIRRHTKMVDYRLGQYAINVRRVVFPSEKRPDLLCREGREFPDQIGTQGTYLHSVTISNHVYSWLFIRRNEVEMDEVQARR